jgi:hypothetical protein
MAYVASFNGRCYKFSKLLSAVVLSYYYMYTVVSAFILYIKPGKCSHEYVYMSHVVGVFICVHVTCGRGIYLCTCHMW